MEGFMNRILLGLSLPVSLVAFADDVRSISLTSGDSMRFTSALSHLTTATIVPDPQNKTIRYRVQEFGTSDGALKLSCSTKILVGAEVSADCSLQFNLTKSTSATEVFEGKLGGVLAARINAKSIATRLHAGLGAIPFISREKLKVNLPNGRIQPSPRLKIDCEKVGSTNSIKSCLLVALPDQTS